MDIIHPATIPTTTRLESLLQPRHVHIPNDRGRGAYNTANMQPKNEKGPQLNPRFVARVRLSIGA